MKTFPHRLGLQQRVLPSYRVPFFDLLAQSCESMSLFAGQPRPVEMIASGRPQVAKYYEAKNIHLFSGSFYLCHQQNLIHWLEEWNPHTLIAEATPRYPSTFSAVRWMHARGRKVIGWGLGAPKRSGFWAGFINQFDAMISYSQRGALRSIADDDQTRTGFHFSAGAEQGVDPLAGLESADE